VATGWWFSPGTPVSSTYQTDRHDINDILLKVVVSAIILTHPFIHVRALSWLGTGTSIKSGEIWSTRY